MEQYFAIKTSTRVRCKFRYLADLFFTIQICRFTYYTLDYSETCRWDVPAAAVIHPHNLLLRLRFYFIQYIHFDYYLFFISSLLFYIHLHCNLITFMVALEYTSFHIFRFVVFSYFFISSILSSSYQISLLIISMFHFLYSFILLTYYI